MMRATIATVLAAAVIAGLLVAPSPGAAGGPPNPCAGQQARHLRCPNLRIGRPYDLYVQRAGRQVRLRATSDVRSRGLGPMELHGIRDGRESMRVNQRIYKRGRGHITLPTRASLHFTDVGEYFGGSYWKVHELANFELWSVDRHHRLLHKVRVGPKLNYCLRDLQRTRPGKRSPTSFHYPGCNQNPEQDRITLGTSVGWSDIYPSDYTKQWIDVAGLRGCFAFVMRVDPHNFFYESDEGDNSSRRLVHLPYRGEPGC